MNKTKHRKMHHELHKGGAKNEGTHRLYTIETINKSGMCLIVSREEKRVSSFCCEFYFNIKMQLNISGIQNAWQILSKNAQFS